MVRGQRGQGGPRTLAADYGDLRAILSMTYEEQQLFSQYLDSNRQVFARSSTIPEGVLYVDCASDDPVIMNATLRIAASFAEMRQLELLAMGTGRDYTRQREVFQSFGARWTTNTYRTMFRGLLAKPLAVWRCFRVLQGRRSLVRLRVNGAWIGKHIYDTLLRRHGLPCAIRFGFKLRLEVAAEICFFFGLETAFARHAPAFVILGDNTYRLGLAFELAKHLAIPAIVGINLQGVAAHLYRKAVDYKWHCRTPDASLIDRLHADPEVQKYAAKALASRTSGAESQHDVVRAYSSDKFTSDATELRNRLRVPPGKKLVVVMAHIFQDAPHAYPGTHFDDYADWLVSTCRELLKNEAVHLIVKEHPSVDLYGEHNVIDKVLMELAPLRPPIIKDVNTRSFFSAADAIVTCGGTCGMEFPCYGIPVVVAARPPYVGFSYIHAAESRAAYFRLLDKIDTLPRLDAECVSLARTVFYALNNVMKVDRRLLGLGAQAPGLGGITDVVALYREMIELNVKSDAVASLGRYLGQVWNSTAHNFVDLEFIRQAGYDCVPTVSDGVPT